MSGRIYRALNSEQKDWAEPGEFAFRVNLPGRVDPKSLRVHWYGGTVLGVRGGLRVEDSDVPDTPSPPQRSSRRRLTSAYRISGTRPAGVDSEAFNPWIEYRLELPTEHRIAEEEVDLQVLRDWAGELLQGLPMTGWEALWVITDQGIQSFLGASLWWVRLGPTESSDSPHEFSPFTPEALAPYREWRPQSAGDGGQTDARALGLTADETTFADRSQWIAWGQVYLPDLGRQGLKAPEEPPEADKVPIEVFTVGPLPRPASWSLKTLERFIQEGARILAGKRKTRSGADGVPRDRERTSILDQVLFDARMAVIDGDWLGPDNQAPDLAAMLGFVLDNYPLVLTFLLQQDDGGYGYALDWEQRRSVGEVPGASPLSDRLTAIAGELVPTQHLAQVLASGLPCHWPIDDELSELDRFEGLFCEGERGDTLLLIPVHAETLGGDGVSIPLVAQVAWPRAGLPLVPELRAGLQRALLAQSKDLRNGLLIHHFSREFGRFEFVRGLSAFFGHNLPKTTVTPLLNVASRLGRAKPHEVPALAARIKGIANLLDTQLKALDVFRLPNSRALETEPLDLGVLLAEVDLVFAALVDDRAFQQESFERVRDQVRLELPDLADLAGLAGTPQVRGFRPASFHAVFVPIDNAFKALTPEMVQSEPGRGSIRVGMEPTPGAVLIRVEDRAGGMSEAELQALRTRLARVAESARLGQGLSLERHGGARSGARLGLGLPLATYFLNLLVGADGQTGGVELDSQPGVGTQVTLRFPINPGQTSLQF